MSAPPSLSRVGVDESPAGEAADAAELAVGQEIHGGDRVAVVFLILDHRPEEVDALREQLIDDIADVQAGDPAHGNDAVEGVGGTGVEPVEDVEFERRRRQLVVDVVSAVGNELIHLQQVFTLDDVFAVLPAEVVELRVVIATDLQFTVVAADEGQFLSRGKPGKQDVFDARFSVGLRPTAPPWVYGACVFVFRDFELLFGHGVWLRGLLRYLVGWPDGRGECCGREDRTL